MMNTNDDFSKKNRNQKNFGFALFLILFGGVFLLLNLGIIPIAYKSLLISWQMLLIVIGLWVLIAKKEPIGGFILMVTGFLFIYPKLSHLFPEYFINISFDIRTYWPVILIIIGLLLVLKKSSCQKTKEERWDDKYKTGNNNINSENSEQITDYIDKNVMFGSSSQIILSSNFRGGDGNVMFGELIIDLRKAKLAEGEHKLELNAMFGSVILYVPTGWNVEVQTSSFLASFEDKRYQSIGIIESPSKLIVKGSCMLGSGEIRN